MIANARHLAQHLQPMSARKRALLPAFILLMFVVSIGLSHAASVDLQVDGVSSTTVDLSWTASDISGLAWYEVTWCIPGQSRTLRVPLGTSTTVTGLSPSTRYSFRVKAVSTVASVLSGYQYATTLEPGASNAPSEGAPEAPTNLQATAISANIVELNWTYTSSNISGFRVYRSATIDGAYLQVGVTYAGVTNLRNIALSPKTTYYYKVCAYSSFVNSEFTQIVSVTTPDVPPAAPSRLSAAATSSKQINLTWLDASQNEDGFKIERATSANGPFEEIFAVEANTTAYADSKLAASTTYFYRVCAFNADGASFYSNVANATTRAKVPDTPIGLKAATASPYQINLSWQDVDDETGYRIQRSTSPTGPFSAVGVTNAGVTAYASLGLSPSTTYYYQVCAYSSAGNSEWSNIAEATTDAIPPTAPSKLSAAVVSSNQINLAWADVAGETEYTIERSANNNANFAAIAKTKANETTYSDDKLASSTTYC